MKRNYIIYISISAFLLSYFLVPFIEIGVWCQNKESSNNMPNASIGILMKVNMFTYTMFLLNGEHIEHGNEICTTK